jgi:very-short-patch-repair endonuclease
MKAKTGVPDEFEAMALRQHGVVSRSQLLGIGVSSAAIGRRVAAGHLRPVCVGVYQVGLIAGAQAKEMAAVLVAGPGAVLSHWSALRLWGLNDAAPARPIHVSVPGHWVRMRPGIVFHRTRHLDPKECSIHAGIPVTSPLRSLVDLAGTLGSRELTGAVAAAERAGLLGPADRESLDARYRGHRGVVLLRTLLEAGGTQAFTRSEAERRFLELLRSAELPPAQTNVPQGPFELDFFWPDSNLAVEVDGFTFHRSRAAFENDRRKDAWLLTQGIRMMRVTWKQITREPIVVAVRVAQALAGSGEPGGGGRGGRHSGPAHHRK